MTITPNYPTPTSPAGSYTDFSDFDPFHPGPERYFSYIVDNTSATGVQNNLIEFVLPAGTNQGLYIDGVFPPDDSWTISLQPDQVVFCGLLTPENAPVNFTFYSACAGVGQEYATATALLPPGQPFNPVLVNVPTVRGDMNRDGQVDAADLEAFGACMTGPQHTGGLSVECARGDLAPDGSIDLADFAELQLACGGGG